MIKIQNQTKNLTYSAVFAAAGLLLPQMFHGLAAAGVALSPMHIPVLLCAFFLPLPYAAGVGAIVPVLSFLLFGMPPAPVMFTMVFELAAYAAVLNVLYVRLTRGVSRKDGGGKFSPKYIGLIYASLAAALIVGRVVNAAAAAVAYHAMGLMGYAGFFAYFWELFAGGVVAIIVQLILIPPLVAVLKERTEKR